MSNTLPSGPLSSSEGKSPSPANDGRPSTNPAWSARGDRASSLKYREPFGSAHVSSIAKQDDFASISGEFHSGIKKRAAPPYSLARFSARIVDPSRVDFIPVECLVRNQPFQECPS